MPFGLNNASAVFVVMTNNLKEVSDTLCNKNGLKIDEDINGKIIIDVVFLYTFTIQKNASFV